eukprot:gene58045-biopygen33342
MAGGLPIPNGAWRSPARSPALPLRVAALSPTVHVPIQARSTAAADAARRQHPARARGGGARSTRFVISPRAASRGMLWPLLAGVVPTAAAAPPSAAAALTAGSEHTSGKRMTCGLRRTDGAARCWGCNHDGQASPPDTGEPYSAIAGGSAHTCALRRADGTARCWGST